MFVLVSFCCYDKYMTKSKLGKKRSYLAYTFQSLPEESQVRNSSRNLSRTMKQNQGGMLLAGLLAHPCKLGIGTGEMDQLLIKSTN